MPRGDQGDLQGDGESEQVEDKTGFLRSGWTLPLGSGVVFAYELV